LDHGKEGTVVLDCVLREDGAISRCAVTSENPPGFEFGAAALKLAPFFKWEIVPGAARNHVKVPVNFKTAG
jgi:TonB family protein